MPLIATRGNAAAGGYGWSSVVAAAATAVELITPTSVTTTGSGSSASISANGSVTFTSCVSVTLNGVFSATYNNYMIVYRATTSTSSHIEYRMVTGGSANSSTLYSYRTVDIANNVETAGFTGNQGQGRLTQIGATLPDGAFVAYVFAPYLEQYTTIRTVTYNPLNNATINDHGTTHAVYVSYDGIYLANVNGNSTGRVAVYGLVG